MDYYKFSPQAALRNLGVDESYGLSREQIQKRRIQFGLNIIPKQSGRGGWTLFIDQFKSILIIILLLAASVSLALGHFTDVYVIGAAVLLNVGLGWWQEYKAQNALEALNKYISFTSHVLRSGKWLEVSREKIVPGDVIRLDPGDKVPADGRLLHDDKFKVMEASLTGESEAVEKNNELVFKADDGANLGDRKNMVFMGTTVVAGHGVMVVTSTGSRTELGQIALSLQNPQEELTPLQKQLDQFSKLMGIGLVAVTGLLFLIGVWRDQPWQDMLLTVIAIMVSAIPEGLAIIVTVVLVIGMQRILKKSALVRRLVSAETLGSTTVICADKTGTLTEGVMKLVRIETASHKFVVSRHRQLPKDNQELQTAWLVSLLCNEAGHINDEQSAQGHYRGEQTEVALLAAAEQHWVKKADVYQQYPRLHTLPFDSQWKYMATMHQARNYKLITVKGAPEVILSMTPQLYEDGKMVEFDRERRRIWRKRVDDLSASGLRVLALAFAPSREESLLKKDLADQLAFVGLVGIKDPLRTSSKETVKKCQAAGMRVVMITGDHKLTARSVAGELGILQHNGQVMEGKELSRLSDDELARRVRGICVFARVSPQHKLRIVRAWQAAGEIVAMTGDGVNDAPALQVADVGVALGSGTELAKETADLVLLNDRFKTIVSAIEEGRGIFHNIKKVILYLLSDSFSEVFIVGASILLGWPVPLLPVQILWINLVGDSFPAMALTQDPKDPDVMTEPPDKERNLFGLEARWLVGLISVVSGLGTLLLFWWVRNETGNDDLARTVAFVSLSVDSLFYVFTIRTLKSSVFRSSLFNNLWLWGAVLVGLGLTLVAVYVPWFQGLLSTQSLEMQYWGLIVLELGVMILLIELVKEVFILLRKEDR